MQWITLVILASALALAAVLRMDDGVSLAPVTGAAMAVGVAVSVLFPVRYHVGGSVHGLTMDEALLVAMLIALPSPWPVLLLSVAVVVAHASRRTPLVRLVFNVGHVALSASAAALAFGAIAVADGTLDLRTVLAAAAAALTYAIVSAVVIAVLFARLGVSSFVDGIADVLPVSRVAVPANLVAGIVLGWLAIQGAAFAVVGIAVVVVLFVAFRVSIGARLQRDRATRLRDVATALVNASGSFAGFDEALDRIATLFGAAGAELLLASGEHWQVGPEVRPTPSVAAIAGLEDLDARAHPPGTATGGGSGALTAPLADGNEVVGALVVHGRQGLEFWDDADQAVLAGVAGEVLVALRNAELLRQIAGERSRLAAQSGLLGGILDAVSDGIAMVGRDGLVRAWNPGMASLTSVAAREAVGRAWSEVLDATDDRGDRASVGEDIRTAAAGATLARTWRLTPANGSDERWVRIVLTPVTDPDQPGVVVVARDVTGAREVDRVKADFIATVSHELRTPLTPLKGFIELASRRQLDEAMQVEMRVSMRRQVNRLESLIDDLLSMAELDRDLVDLRLVELPLDPLLARLPELFGNEGASRLRIEASAAVVLGDTDAVERIVVALVSNALKHTDGDVRVATSTDGTIVTVEVADDGPGIPIGEQEAIFEQFHRLGDHLHRTQGPGLGLPIARALARRLGGDVLVQSSPDGGSRFRACLPLAATDAEARAVAG